MSELIGLIFESFSDVIKGVASGIKTAFEQLLYVDPSATEKVLSDYAKFSFIMLGLSMACGLIWFIVRKIKA